MSDIWNKDPDSSCTSNMTCSFGKRRNRFKIIVCWQTQIVLFVTFLTTLGVIYSTEVFFFLCQNLCLVQRQQDLSLADQKKALYKKDTLSEELLWDKSPNVFCCPGQVFLDGKAKHQVEAETKSEVSNWKVLKFWARVKKNLDFGFRRVKCFNI